MATAAAVAALAAGTACLLAGDRFSKPALTKHRSHVPVRRDHRSEDGRQRAGNPQNIAPWARPSNGPHYDGYYVGGGAAWGGQPRYVLEGTWGWDYFGHLFDKHIALGWWHGQRYQGGAGKYETDGPKIFHREE
jgi:hypothetical protein